MLGTRPGDANDIRFLKRIITDHRSRHLSRKYDDGGGIHECIGQPRHHIRAARSRRYQHHARLASCPCIALRHVHGALFMTSQNMSNASAVQRVING